MLEGKWIILILSVLLLSAGIIDIILGIFYHQAKNSSQSTSNFCPINPACINTPQEYFNYMNSIVPNGGYFGPACVAPNMMGRLIAIVKDPQWMPTTLAHRGRITFALTPDTLARLLPIGRFNASNIVQMLGYAPGWYCGTAAKNYTDCQYRLIVWSTPCPKDASPIIPAYWTELEGFLRNIYRDNTPSLTSAINTIENSGGLLQNYTGCIPEILSPAPNTNQTYLTQMAQANCSPEFQAAMINFSNPNCSCQVPQCPLYKLTVNCSMENLFLSIKNPTAIQLRAYLLSFESFFPEFTGYGYAATTYSYPEASECWFLNRNISDLEPNIVIIKLENQTYV